MTRRINSIQRRIVGGNTANQIQDDIKRAQTTGAAPTLQKAIVLDVITDPDHLTDEELDDLAETVNNAELVDIMPINSVVARIVSNSSGNETAANTILFPFFSSHMMLPVSPGEKIYVIYEDYVDLGTKIGYWLTRTHAPKTVEDANYTHHDRMYEAANNPANYTTEERSKVNSEGSKYSGPSFPNGGNTKETLTLKYDKTTEKKIEPYEQIKQESKSYKLINIEPVPRWRKRPQELVLQGANNTLINLGEDRGGPVDNADDALTAGKAGTIDIVVGRSRKTPEGIETGNETPEKTNPRTIKNSRGDFETDKAPHRRSFLRKDNPAEGNPDFIDDAARIYVTMQSEVDRRFQLKLNPAGSLKLPEVAGKSGTFNRSHVVGKADHIRMVAREDNDSGIKGTVLLIREGKENETLGYFFIDEDGNIQIESEKIYFGRSVEEKEPYVLWSRFDESRRQLQNQINEIEAQIDLLTTMLQTSLGTAIGNLGAPIPSLLGISSKIKDPSKNLKSKLPSMKQAAETASAYDSQSKKIYGE